MHIGRACVSIDLGPTSSLKFWNPWAQGWHFNTSRCPWGSETDSRVIHAVELLTRAIDIGKDSSKHAEALWRLGECLHPAQDVNAHAPGFVTKYEYATFRGADIFSHVTFKGEEADNPFHIQSDAHAPAYSPPTVNTEDNLSEHIRISQRYSDTKTTTEFCMLIFLLCCPDFPIFTIEEKIKRTWGITTVKETSKTPKNPADRKTFLLEKLADIITRIQNRNMRIGVGAGKMPDYVDPYGIIRAILNIPAVL